MDDQSIDGVTKQRSFYVKASKICNSQEICKSEVNISSNENSFSDNRHLSNITAINGQYTSKNVECVKLSKGYVLNNNSSEYSYIARHASGRGDNKDLITNSELDDIEMKLLGKKSQELQTDDNSVGSLDSNIKIFKITVQHILENFYDNLNDFEMYKKRFNDILEKNKGNSVADMENLIKDLIQHIGSSDSSVASNQCSKLKDFSENLFKKRKSSLNIDSNKIASSNLTAEMFHNENYMTDSTFEQISSKYECVKDKSLNFSFLKGSSYVEIKKDNRSLFSEINIREKCINTIRESVASTENIKKIEAKKLELANYENQDVPNVDDIDIPVRNSYAKKNIHLDDDFLNEKDDTQKFFMFRICNYICRKFRKN